MADLDEDITNSERAALIREARRQAMRAFGEHLEKAGHVWVKKLTEAASTLNVRDITPKEAATSEERIALDTVEWLGRVFALCDEMHDETADHLHRMWETKYPSEDDGPRIARAFSIIKEQGERYRVAAAGDENYRGNPVESIAWSLTIDLFSRVDPAFQKLEEKQDEVLAILARYEPDEAKRGRRKNSVGKTFVGANGALQELATLAGWRTLSPSRITNAVRDHG